MSRPRSDLEGRYRAREGRKADRAARGERPRPEEATSIEEALEAEREAGRAEGRKASGPKPTNAKPPAPARATNARARAFTTGALSASGSAGVTAPLMIEVALITADELANQHRLPVPSRFLAAFAFFGALGLAKGSASPAASALGWGVVLASFYAFVGQPGGLRAIGAVGDFLGGKYGKEHLPGDVTTRSAATGRPETTAGLSVA